MVKKKETKTETASKENSKPVDKEVLKDIKEKEKAINNKCPACGAPISFSPSLNKWKCEYCSASDRYLRDYSF